MLLGRTGLCNACGGAWRRRVSPLLGRYQAPLSPPPPKSLGGLHDGIGAGSAAGIEGAAGFGAERRFGAAFLRADFFLVDRFADAFVVLRFLRDATVFFFLVDRFFAFVLFAMIDLPIPIKVQNSW
jgi:hypothetical protein